jgi:NAD(P)-dependent dehydrogenase (short-subunit alcohol dehydrogenase family)
MAVALVTGASSGIGLATAVTLARGGHAVIATMRNLNAAGELRKIVSEEKLPAEVGALKVDDDASVRDAIDRALAERRHIDVLGPWLAVVAQPARTASARREGLARLRADKA